MALWVDFVEKINSWWKVGDGQWPSHRCNWHISAYGNSSVWRKNELVMVTRQFELDLRPNHDK